MLGYEGPVRVTAELERILKIRRRVIDFESPEAKKLAYEWSKQLLNPAGLALFERFDALPEPQRSEAFALIAKPRNAGGENCPLLLSPEQAITMYEAYHLDQELLAAEGLHGGLCAFAGIGFGKTLLSWLLSLILGAGVPLLMVPGNLERKTHDDFADLSRYWLAPRPTPQILTFETLQHPNHEQILCSCIKCTNKEPKPETPSGIRPTHIFVDESDGFKKPKSARTRRLGRYMSKHPQTFYGGMTATPWTDSITDAAPQLIWALKTRAPVPLTFIDRQVWSQALDFTTRDGIMRDPGALTWLAGVDPAKVESFDARLELATQGFKNRLLETPGVVQTRGQSCSQPLIIRLLKAPDDPILDAAFHHFRKTGTRPDGVIVEKEPLRAHAHATELSCGFWYKWEPPPPEDWLAARQEATRFVNEQIEKSGRAGKPLDSSAPVYRAFPNEPCLLRWKAIEPSYKPDQHRVPVPLTASILAYAAAWMKVNGPGLVWVRHDYIGHALSAMTGVPYFGSQGKDPTGLYIAKYSAEKNAILSIKSNGRGRNIQSWHRNLVLGPPSSPTDWEQAICGRTHRNGQDKPVFIDVVISCAENVRAIEKARGKANWMDTRTGASHKLLIADFDYSHFPAAELETLPDEHPSCSRWRKAA